MFLIYEFFSKCAFLRLRHFVSPTIYPINSIFSVALCICQIHVFDEVFFQYFLLAIISMITEKMSFSCFIDNLCQGKIPSSYYATYQSRLYLKKWNQIDKVRSSRPQVLCKKSVLRNFAKFTGKHMYQRVFFNKLAGLGLIITKLYLVAHHQGQSKRVSRSFLGQGRFLKIRALR